MTFRLSKSRFQMGLQCPKALWLLTHEPGLADPVPESRQHIFDTGTRVGELARERFTGGVLVAEDYTQPTEALETTNRLLTDPPPAIFEAAVEHDGVFVRPDALVRIAPDLWDLYEVKSSTRVKPENITDVAVQAWVLEGAGLRIRRAYLMHLDNSYVYQGGAYDLDQLFTAEDVTERVRGWMPEVPQRVAEFREMLGGPEPTIAIGRHCDSPYDCSFFGHCHEFLPDRSVVELPRISPRLLDALIADGIYAIADIPLDYPGLSSAQREVCELARSGGSRLVGDVASALSELDYPLHFLDFETFMSALPLFKDTRPYQQVPFQWSDHVLGEDGSLQHREFLFESRADPRSAFVESLVDATADAGSIVVYSSFENSRLNELARDFPGFADAIARVQKHLFDLLPVVRAHVRHPDCLGSSSIKAVLPALVPDLSYQDLTIAEGGTASLEFLRYQLGQKDDDEAALMFANLREYCARDTTAMVRVLEALR
jgi:hypothetical protein